MLPVRAGAQAVARQIVGYSYIMVATSLVVWPVARTGWFYPAAAVVLGAAFLLEAHRLLRRSAGTDDVVSLKPMQGLTDAAAQPMRLFHWSNMYLSLLFVAVALDPLLKR